MGILFQCVVKLLSLSTYKVPLMNRQTMVVAEIETPVVLGYDFMCKHHCQIDVPKGEVLLNGNLVKCIYESTLPSIFRKQVAKNITVPHATEMVVPAKIEGCTPHITTLQLEDPKTGLSVRVLASSQANQSTEVPQTDSAVGILPTDIDNIQRAQREDVENWCRACIECQRAENETRKPKARLQVSRVGAPM